MLRLAIGGLLVAHGLVHAALWLPQAVGVRRSEDAPFDPGHSWLLSGLSDSGVRTLGCVLAVAAAIALAGAGLGYIAEQAWWPVAAMGGAGTSLALIVLYWDVWLSVGVLIDVAVVAGAIAASTAASPDG